MKKLLQRVFGIAVSAVLLVTSGMTALAAEPGHSHNGGTCINETEYTTKGADDYTITLTYPKIEGKDSYKFNKTDSNFGAYQIFSGTVKGEDYTTDTDKANPGTTGTAIPITDVKWGNAFGDFTQVDTKKKILEFVYALDEAPKNSTYGYAFEEFTGFQDFFDNDGKLNSAYTDSEVTVDSGSITADDDVIKAVKFDKLAVAVSDVLIKEEHIKDHEWLQAFTDILGGYAQGASGYENPGYAIQYYKGFVGTTTEEEESEKYTIYVPAGYYMIRDLSTINESDESDPSQAFSARMLFVANNVEQVLKVDVPRLDKKVLRNGSNAGDTGNETDVAGVGDVVHFQLKGTLPSNYNEYLGGYKYKFEDTLSKGLDLSKVDGTVAEDKTTDNAFVTVNVKGLYSYNSDSKEWTWNADKSDTLTLIPYNASKDTTGLHTGVPHLQEDEAKNYKLSYTDHTLTVEFPCLKEIVIVEDTSRYRLGADSEHTSEIYVDYYAKVNKDAVVSPKKDENENGNFNTAQIQYSNNPQSYNDMDYTVVDRATVYTFGLDIVKIDAAEFLRKDTYESHENEVGLKDAKFVLVRPTNVDTNGKPDTNTTWEIAKFAKVEKDDVDSAANLPNSFTENGYYTITEWTKIGDDKKGTTFNEEWLTDDHKAETGEYVIKSLDKGILNVSGLDVDREYTMVETATPDDTKYAKIAPFTVILKTQSDTGTSEYDGKLSTGTNADPAINKSESFTFDKYVQMIDPVEDKSDTDGSANMLVANFRYVDLPSTGGVGTYWFYILGAGGLAISFLLFKMSKKKVA